MDAVQNEKQLETLRQQQYPQPPQAQKPAQDHASPLVPVQIPPAVQSSPIRPPPQPTNPPAGPRLFPPLLHTALTALHLTATQSYTLLAALKALNQLTQPPLKAWRDMLQVYARVERVLAVAAEKDKQAGSETGRVRRVVSILDKNAVLGAAAGSGSASEDMLAGGGSELASVPAWLPSLLDKQAALARDKAEVERVASFREYVGEFDREAVEGWMGGGVGRDLDRADGQGKGGGWFGR
ncbi:hypothetical protein BU26DRAFT_134621 [Trematosphaeria pertusa]|uniref:Uncharacterized protein n=1 Tax=Trematosphaeria pertusa TaxID=390896 RepID=A0A6A6IUD7_9PLEO|nr:uncharacterized protein BU26DRAFT_134621 [Trematosphaeria pertusa]KAF2254175.1 hypothetical protein BU26DRAFT_134621 [Trematosphaeria pertusa]